MTVAEIEAAVSAAGLEPLGPEIANRFAQYLDLLLKWNARLNLTAIREPGEIVQRHFVECIFAARHLPAEIRTLLDFGSGGGFPGIPIALCKPGIHVTLGESQLKKAVFLREVVRTLGLGDTEVYSGRAEGLDQTFDAVTLRAVDKMQEACRGAMQRLSPKGQLILFVGEEMAQRLVVEFDKFDWGHPVLLPQSMQRWLLMGCRRS